MATMLGVKQIFICPIIFCIFVQNFAYASQEHFYLTHSLGKEEEKKGIIWPPQWTAKEVIYTELKQFYASPIL